MNLLFDPWIEVERLSGRREHIAPWQLTTQLDDPIAELLAPRADFRGALYQFLIGLLQTAFAPLDLDEWKDRWQTPPSTAQLQQAFAAYLESFELDSDGPAFMQDFDLPEAEHKGVAALLVESPGEKTVRDNLDHFVQRGAAEVLCAGCAATALFTLQINAPSGGVGHRVSLRGGGPLTTLLLPASATATLWQKLWLNILPQEALDAPVLGQREHALPWTAPTRTSDPKGVGDTTPETVHLLQAYWSMPRRIRLTFADVPDGSCDLCGACSERLVTGLRARNYGVNYTGAWVHPLTPYSHDPKGEKPPLSLKGQKGGIGYRDWLGLALGSDDHQPDAAKVVAHFNAKLQPKMRNLSVRLWCFGYDMDNMKARCWYDSTLPLYSVPTEVQHDFAVAVRHLLLVAREAAKLLHQQIKAARFSRPGDVGNEPAIGQSFWQGSETDFYALLERLARADLEDEAALAPLYRDWLNLVRRLSLRLFDEWVLAAPIEDMKMRRVVQARADLGKWLYAGKVMKPLWKLVNSYQKESA